MGTNYCVVGLQVVELLGYQVGNLMSYTQRLEKESFDLAV